MRIAVIDLGTNTFNLLVAEAVGDGLRTVYTSETGVFLGRGGLERGVLQPEALARGRKTLLQLLADADAHGASAVTAIGTSALRNARNRDALFAGIERSDLSFRVISGAEEAELILLGVRQGVPFGAKPALVMDIGGGSIEFTLATAKATMWKGSFDLGASRLLERFSPADPLSLDMQLRMATHIDSVLEPLWAVMDRHWPRRLIGCAGCFDTLSALLTPDSTGPHSLLDMDRYQALADELMHSPRTQRIALGVPEFRLDTLPIALLLIDRVLLRGIERLECSRYALKEGVAATLLNSPPCTSSPGSAS